MPALKDLGNIWKNLREVDLRPLREAALQGCRIALVGAAGSGRHTLADAMRRDPARADMYLQSPVLICDLDNIEAAEKAELIVVLLDVSGHDFERERTLVRQWNDAGKNVMVFCNKLDLLGDTNLQQWDPGPEGRVLFGSALNVQFLHSQFVPAVMALLPERHLALGRQFPLFRLPIARQLINETCFSNAAYALSTGIAEVVPVLDLPLNVTDMIVLTKAQAFLAYKLGLTLGYSTRWQDYVAEFGGVVGSGFIWRQVARQLVGLVPVWGIIPKVAVSYSGTYVVGHAILQWYLTGRHITRQQMRDLYLQAFNRGKEIAQSLLAKAPRLRLGKGQKAAALADGPAREKRPFIPWGKRKQPALPEPGRLCPQCAKLNAIDARFCQYCGKPLEVSLPPDEISS